MSQVAILPFSWLGPVFWGPVVAFIQIHPSVVEKRKKGINERSGREKKGRKKENLENLCSRGFFGALRVSLDTGKKEIRKEGKKEGGGEKRKGKEKGREGKREGDNRQGLIQETSFSTGRIFENLAFLESWNPALKLFLRLQS